MKNIPVRIYLQIDADGETPEDFNDLVGVSWSDERIHDNDLVYVLELPKGQSKQLSCPECGSNRILERKDKYQCRLCWNTWAKY